MFRIARVVAAKDLRIELRSRVVTNQVLPFAVSTPYPMQIDGTPLETYLDWMKSAFRITMTSHPAASAPVAFAENGLPVGMQIIGHYGSELEVLQLAHAVQLPLAERIPQTATA